jgi:ATP-dependent RNA helicase RhlE
MSFKDYQFHPKINAGIASCGYTTPTPIQKEAMPSVLKGRDILGLAQTGTGKTAAFVLPLLQRLVSDPRKNIRALIVAPTRELAEQIHVNIGQMAKHTNIRSVVIYGGVGKQPQINGVKAGAQIIVACPGRLLDLLNQKAFNLRSVEVLVLDEADHMFDKGFLPDIRRIIKQLPRQRQTLVFSATMPKEIRHLAEDILQNPIAVQINNSLPVPSISHLLFQVTKTKKTALLKSLITKKVMTKTLVFTRTKHKAKSLALQLQHSGFNATAIQGNLSQSKRQQAMEGFRDGTFEILVATDIAARGIDVSNVSHVVNYDVPDTAETYTHRTGRTGRASRSGEAFTFASYEDSKMVALIERNPGFKMNREPLPDLIKEADQGIVSEKSDKFSRGTTKRKKPTTASRATKQRSKDTSFDFGIGRRERR